MIKTPERGHSNEKTVSYYDTHAVATLYPSQVMQLVLVIQYRMLYMMLLPLKF
jgi:hypothetical protein